MFFIDVETTGVTSKDRLCSVALLEEEKLHFTLVQEVKKIPPLASSVHNITTEMIQNAPRFVETSLYQHLCSLDEKILVAHNAMFDIEMLGYSGYVHQGKMIDTLRCTRHLIPDLEQYSLNFLRYEMKLYQKEKALAQHYGVTLPLVPHDAQSDVIITKLLLEELLLLAPKEQLLLLSTTPVLLQKFPFGKYAGRYIEEIALSDRSYLAWMVTLEDLDEDMRYTLEYYL